MYISRLYNNKGMIVLEVEKVLQRRPIQGTDRFRDHLQPFLPIISHSTTLALPTDYLFILYLQSLLTHPIHKLTTFSPWFIRP